MAVSQNGWPAVESSAGLVPLRWVTGRVVGGDVHTILDHLGARFNAEVETITVPHSWGWAHRPVRGATVLSNHASGTAVDFNAPKHPLGARGTFTPAQVAAIRRILTDLGGTVRWGGDYAGRADEMHFEINANAAQVATTAARLRGGTSGGGQSAAKPTPTKPVDTIGRTMLLNSDSYRARKVLGVLCLNGSFTEIKNQGEFDNLRAAGVPFANVTDTTLNELIREGRGAYKTVAVRK